MRPSIECNLAMSRPQADPRPQNYGKHRRKHANKNLVWRLAVGLVVSATELALFSGKQLSQFSLPAADSARNFGRRASRGGW